MANGANGEPQERPNCLIKLSGDAVGISDELKNFIREKMKTHFVVVLVGGGRQINDEFRRRGWNELADRPHGVLGRELDTLEQKQVARDVLERNQARVQDLLAQEGIMVTVEIPVFYPGTVLTHLNGDLFVQACYLSFQELFIITTPERVQQKRNQFQHLPKIRVVAF